MAVAAYAALVSLMNVLTRYQHPTCPVPFDQSQIQTLLEKVSSLIEFLEIYYDSETNTARSRGSIQDLESKMTSAAHAAEDIIEISYVNRVLDRDGLELCPNLQNSIEEMDQFIQESMDCRVKRHKNDHQEEHGTKHEDPSVSRPRDNNFMVGFDEQLSRLMDLVRMHNPSREIIPIVGMGGIGKTTLAKNVYNHPYVVGHFDIRAWVTISQRYVVKEIILSLLRDIKVSRNDNVELVDQLYQGLWGRKYLIILDDIWSCEAWFEIMRFFPDNSNGSRILLTTRLCRVARRVGLSSTYEMEFLDDDESFNLLSKMVYGLEVFPRELEILGKEIAKSCKGLPLAIMVIGGVLKMCSKTSDYWKDFAENLSSFMSEDNNGQCLGILSLSYNHLPIHLKPCFLHMAAFEEDKEIDVSNLINLWVAEGFLKPTKDRRLNEIALEYLNDLIDRNLIMVGKKRFNRKTCTMHDLLRELCLREAQNENFTCVIEADTPNLTQRIECERRIVCKFFSYSNALLPSMPHVRCLYVTGYWWCSMQLTSVCGLLRMMNIMDVSELQMDFVQLVNIRYLEVADSYEVRNWLQLSLSLLWNLETLIITYGPGYGVGDQLILPSKIWELPNLRHLEFKANATFLDPTGGQINCVLNNLQTIRTVGEFFCTDEVFRLIPNLKELSIEYGKDGEIDYDKLSRSFTNLALLCKLELLSVNFFSWSLEVQDLNKLENLTFSPYLRELKLSRSKIPWENMTIVGSLPNLEVLKLTDNAFCGKDWDCIDGEFERLKYLSISYCTLGTWKVESSHFPRLEHLRLHGLVLEQVPYGIGEISSLETIELVTDKMSCISSAKEILEERKNQGDDDLLIKVLYYGGSDEEITELEKWAEADNNFHIEYRPGIEGFQIIGEAKPGCRLVGCGYSVRGTSLCMFQWVRHHPDGTRQYIEGATKPVYVLTADDVDKLVAVECIPMDEQGRQGEIVRVFANDHKKITW